MNGNHNHGARVACYSCGYDILMVNGKMPFHYDEYGYPCKNEEMMPPPGGY